MNDTKRKTGLQKVEFDYFYVLLKNWKAILLSCVAFLLVGLAYIFILPKPYTAKSTLSVALNTDIHTNYGAYHLKTDNPLHYLKSLEQKKFKDSVLVKTESKNLNGITFEVKEEKIKVDTKISAETSPKKFDFIVYGEKKDKLVEINEQALSMFLINTDRNIQNDMYNQFSSGLKIQIDSFKFIIQSKEKLINELKRDLKSGVQIKTDKTNFKNLIDDRLINSLEGSERGLIVAMMLNGDKGNKYYQETMLSYEEVQLKILENSLERQDLLLKNLIETNEKGNLSTLFNLPFSNNYFLLSSAEVREVSYFSRDIKRIIIFLFFGLLISSSVVLISSYYKLKYKEQ
jgi:hypothetical protein